MSLSVCKKLTVLNSKTLFAFGQRAFFIWSCSMSNADIFVIFAYLAFVLCLGLKVGRKNETDNNDYYLAGRSMPMLPVALSIAATTISANAFIGAPGWAYADGMSAYLLHISIPFVLFLTCSSIIPFFYRLGISSIYEYLGLRFGRRAQTIVSLSFMVMAIIQVGAMIYTPSIVISHLTGFDIKLTIPLIIFVSFFYTATGGLKAVIVTDVIQMFLVWSALLLILYVAFSSLGFDIETAFATLQNNEKLTAFDNSLSFSNGYGIGISFLGSAIVWAQYYISDQSAVQRLLSCKNEAELKKSMVFGAIFMNIVYFILIVVGLLFFINFDGQQFQNSNLILVEFVSQHIKTPAKGLIIVAILAAAMSSVDSILNSLTTSLSKDICKNIFKDGNPGKLTTYLMGLASAVAIYFSILVLYIGNSGSIIELVSSNISIFSGSILSMFILALFFPSTNEKNALIGFSSGIIVNILIVNLTEVHWFYYSIFGLSTSICIALICNSCTTMTVSENNYTLKIETKSFFGFYPMILAAFFLLQYIILFSI